MKLHSRFFLVLCKYYNLMSSLANPEVDVFFKSGCMRCAYGDTPQCKVHSWTQELILLRKIALKSGLHEELKWGVPCYTFQGKNVILIGAFKESIVLSFLKGVLLKDPFGILAKPGENSQTGRVVKFTNLDKIFEYENALLEYIQEAVEIEKAGTKVETKTITKSDYPQELLHKFMESTELEKAFEALTPGRKKGYLIFFTQPKQSKTIIARIEKYIPLILEGKGMMDSYKK
jgi:uncharacterized protein YdeI (YjbR/CyaY-like superfamily)